MGTSSCPVKSAGLPFIRLYKCHIIGRCCTASAGTMIQAQLSIRTCPSRRIELSPSLSLSLSFSLSPSLTRSLFLSCSLSPPPSLSPALSRKTQAPSADSCDPLASTGTLDLNPCGLVANSVFNDKIVVSSAPSPYDSLPPYEYMDESEI